MSVLKMQACGYLGQDSTLNVVNGKSVINGSLAYSEKWTDAQGNKKEKTTWVNFSWWVDRTNVLQYMKKGQLCYIEGLPEARNYTTRTGEVVAQLTCRVLDFKLLGGQKNDVGSQPNAAGHTTQQVASDISAPDDSIPF